VSAPLVVVDADVLGRERTGDETYVENLLRALPALAGDELRIAAVTRHPERVPEGVEAIHQPARLQELRMAWSLPRLLRRLRPALAHFQHVIAPGSPSPRVVTVHDLSFERDRRLMGRIDRIVFRTAVPLSVRRAAHVLAVSERTKADIVELYGLDPDRITVTPHGVDPAFTPNGRESGGYVLFVGAIQERKHPLAASDAATEVGMPLVVVGPSKDGGLARELRRRGADLRGYVSKPELADLYRGAACLVLPSRYEGFGLPVLEAMACGTPVVAGPDSALREVGGDAALYASEAELAGAIRRAVAERDRWRDAGLARARRFSWEETARLTLEVYRRVLRR
jgi:glycosyltransferase involved in cell wall biosynthesis